METVVWRHATGASWPVWDVLIPLVGVSAGLATQQLRGKRLGSSGLSGTVAAIAGTALMFGVVLTLSALRSDDRGRPSSDADGDTGAAVDYDAAPPVLTATSDPTATEDANAQAEAVWGELYSAATKRNWKGSLTLLEQLIAVDPTAGEDSDVRKVVMEVAKGNYFAEGDQADRMTVLLTEKMGKSGPDILFELIVTAGKSKAADNADRLLKDEDIRARGSAGMRIAYDLRKAKSCDDMRMMAERAGEEGDYRAKRELEISLGCRRGPRCCPGNDEQIKAAIAAIESRR
jgi:hypothetical protein